MRLLKAIIPYLVVLAITPPPDLHAQSPVPAAQTHTVEVDGHTMRAQSYGLNARVAGAPVVVFEAGASNALEVWSRVAPEVAALAPVVTYDRAGLGQSEWDGETPTPEHVAGRLSQLLEEIGADPPYVLVGYSWGGPLVRYFAGLHPEAVSGIVYVDPGPIVTQTPAEDLVPFEEVGVGRAGHDALFESIAALMENAPPAMRAEFEVITGLMRRAPGERGLLPVPPVPAAVIVAGRYQAPPPMLQLPYDPQAHFEADVRHRVHMLAEWALASPAGILVVSRSASHAVPMEDPGLVVWAVRRVLSTVEQHRGTQ